MTFCEICGKEFSLDKSLHLHLKAHKVGVPEYYSTFFPRFDKYSNSPIEFKNKKQYFSAAFNNEENMEKWLATTDVASAQDFLSEFLLKKLQEKEFDFFPSDLYLRLAELPNKDWYNRYYESCGEFCKNVDLDIFLDKELPKNFWEEPIPKNLDILIDTREQKPLKLPESSFQKLDFGDYTSRSHYSKTFIERKSAADFASTMVRGFSRLCREIDRCRKFNSYIFILVESTPDLLFQSLAHKPNMDYLWHNTRQLMIEFPKNVQICFSGNRSGSQFLIPKILFYGQKLWNVDLEFYLHRKIKKDVVG